MNSKTLITVALASAFAFSNSMLYADEDKQEALKPELTAQSDEQSAPPAPAPELTAQSDEQTTQPVPAPELTAQSDEQTAPPAPAPELIVV